MTTNQDPFEDPAHGDRIVFDDVNGSLLLFTVHSVEHGIETAFGESDAVKCDVAVLDGDQKGTTFENTLIFPRVLQGALGPKVGKKVLGRRQEGRSGVDRQAGRNRGTFLILRFRFHPPEQ
jgi:hypothetical protein